MQNKGYFDISKFPFGNPEPPRLEELTVICNFCNSTWKEKMPSRANIAGYAKRYDFCSLCEQKYFTARGQVPMRAFREAQEFRKPDNTGEIT